MTLSQPLEDGGGGPWTVPEEVIRIIQVYRDGLAKVQGDIEEGLGRLRALCPPWVSGPFMDDVQAAVDAISVGSDRLTAILKRARPP